jgi:RNA polymerase sigma factor (sigma-70 family)
MNTNLPSILKACCKGDLSAQRTLFDLYKSKLFVVCLRYSRDRPEAQDLLQDAFLTIFRDLNQYSGQGAFDGWIHRVTVRTALQHLRKKNPLRFADDYNEIHSDAWNTPPETELNGESILQLVQSLPLGYRTVFNMHCVEAWSYKEIADELGIAESSVRSQYARACKQLRTLVEKHLNAV